MAEYTRAELLQAVRTDHPELANVGDNELFRAIAVDHPDIAHGIQELNMPEYRSGNPRDRSWSEVMQDQTVEAIKGVPEAVTGIPGMVSELGHALTGTGKDRVEFGKKILGGLYAPVKPFVEMQGDPDSPDWQASARSAGANLGATVLGAAGSKGLKAIKGAGGVSAALDRGGILVPERARAASFLMEDAAGARAPLTGAGKDAMAVAGASGTVPNRILGATIGPVRKALASAEEAVARKIAPQVEQISPDVSRLAKLDEIQGQGLPGEEPFSMSVKKSAPAPLEIPGENLPQPDEFSGLETTKPGAPPEMIPGEGLPKPGEIMPGVPDAEVLAIEREIHPTGSGRLSTLKNVPKLMEVLPEIRGKRGPDFDKALLEGLDGTTQAIDAIESTIPRETMIDKGPILEAWNGMREEFAAQGYVKSLRQIEKIIDVWKEKAPSSIPWETFLALKRGFFKELASRTSPTMRRAYGVLMKTTSELSPELAEANRHYAVVRQAIDDAKLDPASGRRITSVGKPPEGSFKPAPQGKQHFLY